MTLVLLVIVIQLIVISTNRTHSSISLRGREARLNTYLMVWLFEVLIADDPAAHARRSGRAHHCMTCDCHAKRCVAVRSEANIL